MRKLNSTTVNAGGKTAIVGGGTLQWEATRALFATNKQAVKSHGLCECVLIIGPLMGGASSILQARHDYALDKMLASCSTMALLSLHLPPTTPGLFCALRGAGHNFGIVSIVHLTWCITASSPVFGILILRVRPIAYTIAYEGPESGATVYAAPFQALDPTVTQAATNVDYVALYTVSQNSFDSAACRRNLNTAYDIFAELTADSRFSTSVLLENYCMQGVEAVGPASTALSLEEHQFPIVANPIIWWEGNSTRATADAYAYGESIRQALFAGAPTINKHAYANYAIGAESTHGYEGRRVSKLKALKKAYGPKNKFGFYKPMPVAWKPTTMGKGKAKEAYPL
ncbi:hypothetical protein CC80DRAFT_553857 [Byssothecium circinans]|uniref:Berberine/berberine-like domain-containing protein n=1 Tax=Byssothecium circinans TaxID=147558 RepID=A0A6A5TGQ0_9PLEO|nr:hypothetical protein CC80DRAFT_553857 [Byssothecium circinans]